MTLFLKIGSAHEETRPQTGPENFSKAKSHSEISSAMIIAAHEQFFQFILAARDTQPKAARDIKVATFQCLDL